jgi:hypothetical protein
MQMFRLTAASALLLWTLVPPDSAAAQFREPPDLAKRLEATSLVVEGVVEAIRHRDSAGPPEEYVVLPHTFVTYRITEMLRGNAEGGTITLRFLGGPAEADGHLLVVPTIPVFNKGDTDILLITAANGTAACPLAACSGGRFRVHDGRVYTDLGYAILIEAAGSLTIGDRRLGADVIRTVVPPVSADYLKAERERLAAESTRLTGKERARREEHLSILAAPRTLALGGTPPAPASDAIPSVDRATFLAHLRDLAAKLPTPGGPAVSADPDVRFTVARPKQVPLRVTRRDSPPAEADLEEQLLRRNDGNPVLTRR